MGVKDISKTMTLRDGVTPTLRKINAGTVQYKKSLRDLREVGSKTWTSVRSGLESIKSSAVGAVSAILGVAGASSTIGFGTHAASELEGYRMTLNTVMKDTKKAGEIMQWATQFANITPFDTDEVVEGTVRLQAYGINAQTSMRSIGDMAAVMNKDLMQAIEAVADAQTGELERMKEFGITKAMIQKKADQMFRGQTTINNKGQIVDQQRFNQALFALMDDRFKGGMEKQAQTFKGLMSTVTGTWKMGIAEIMGVNASGEIRKGSLFEEIKKQAKEAGDAMTRLAEDGTFKRWGDNLVSVYNSAVGTFRFFRDNWPMISPIVYGVAAAIAAYKSATFFASLWTVVLGRNVTFAAIRTTVYGTASLVASGEISIMAGAQRLLNAAMRANPVGTIIVLLGMLVAAGTYVVNNWETVKLAGMRTWNVVVGAAEWAVNAYFAYANFMLKVYKFAWDSIEFAGKSIWNGILSAGEAGVNGFIGLINSMIEKSLDGINTLIRGANKASKSVGLGSVMDEMTFGGINKVDFGGAAVKAEKPKWDSDFNVFPKVNFSSAKFSDDKIMTQTTKAQKERDKKQSKSDQELKNALKENTNALNQNSSATGDNTSATNSNTKATLTGNRSATDIADSLLSRIERHLYDTM
ncbi:hypothetical protein SAMN05216312_12220 [Cohnella sp. OV330]|uniref:tape measure protein n=1 Tax=Cohnella sp. OV330 TaxID=1855288 RepID=UPI0008E3BF10|nr:tape measure protein [Cohnella sp. OV330]SFB62575.1 hypothetical protein SAMN05216312_12220 [Cohnella sp. OV330]